MFNTNKITEARKKRKQIKKDHFVTLTAEAIENGKYKFEYGYNSNAEFEEIIEVIDEINKSLASEKLILTASSIPGRACEIKVEGQSIGRFENCCVIFIEKGEKVKVKI
jgi:hypothetical protein